MFYLGCDVSKAKLDCTLLLDPLGEKRKAKTVVNTKEGVNTLLAWAVKQDVPLDQLHVVIEATGVYHEVAAMALFNAGVKLSIVNPAQVRNFARGMGIRTKNDAMDSAVLSRFGNSMQPPAWQPPPQEVRDLQALLSRREAVAADLLRERNREEKIKSATTTSLPVIQSIVYSIEFLETELSRLQKLIDDHIDRHPHLKAAGELLRTIPGVGPQVSNTLLPIIVGGSFNSAEQLAAYLGLVPVESQSGSSISGRPRISKAGPSRVRAILYMAAVVAIRYNQHIKALYKRLLAKGKSKMSAIGAAMRKLVHLCFGVLKTGKPYCADYAK
ncbi:transposase [Gammaproteobacteria bacterium]